MAAPWTPDLGFLEKRPQDWEREKMSIAVQPWPAHAPCFPLAGPAESCRWAPLPMAAWREKATWCVFHYAVEMLAEPEGLGATRAVDGFASLGGIAAHLPCKGILSCFKDIGIGRERSTGTRIKRPCRVRSCPSYTCLPLVWSCSASCEMLVMCNSN